MSVATLMARKGLDALLESMRDAPAEGLGDFVADCEVLGAIAEKLHQNVQLLMNHGTEAQRLIREVRELIDVLDSWQKAVEATSAALVGDRHGEAQQALERMKERAVSLRAEQSSFLAWLAMPRPPIDLSKLPPANHEAKGYIGMDEFLSQLLAERSR